ncbi:MAG: lipid-A-disaccharide synthase [Candidatus Fonsibacter sp.]|nr:lipid-A-disaccharide synthase [Candidatus Fonsibacter sp.]
MSKKIFIITGESSGDKIASLVIRKLKKKDLDIQFLAIGGENIKSEKVNCIFDIKDIAYMGLIDVLKNLFSIKEKINLTVKKIIEFKPDIIFSIDSPDFSFRILDKVKNLNNKIKTIHLVAPQVWAWRENRKKKLYKFIDHLLLLFPFEKKYFMGFLKNSYVGHPFFDFSVFKVNKLEHKNKKYFTLCPGSRNSELKIFMPIFIEVIKQINLNNNFIFHIPSSENNKDLITNYLHKSKIDNFIITTNETDKNFYIQDSILTISKSGTITLDICKNQCPLIVVYRTSLLNYLLIKPFVKTKFGNILNIIAQKEIIPELIQEKCNSNEIYIKAKKLIDNELLRKEMVSNYTKILEKIIVPNSLDKICQHLLE